MLRKLRITFASLFIVLITLLFLDFTGTIHQWFGWMAKIQFIPALLALNVGVIVALVLLTLIFGRLYCSVICPLGVFQDAVSSLNRKKNHFSYSKAITWLRYAMLGIMILAFIAGIGSLFALLEPYSAYGRMVSNLLTPIYQGFNNLFAYVAERFESYAFYQTDVWIKSMGTFIVAFLTFCIIVVLAWRNGRTYCNTICPVGTVLGFLSRFSIFKVRIDTEKCNSCGLCARNCKGACIDPKSHTIDYSRCVSCYNCLEKCNKQALQYAPKLSYKSKKKDDDSDQVDESRRNMLAVSGALIATTTLKTQETKVDGGLAFIEDKKIPNRLTPIVPPGALSIRNFTQRCTACQLCVSSCPNGVLRPSSSLLNFMQPEVSYERGYCRPECTLCSEVCPAGAIQIITKEDKSSTQVGHAVWVQENCVVLTDEVECGNCARHCPVGAIEMVMVEEDSLDARTIPIVNTERCIGCGACEYLCPARPFSAIYVEGHRAHKVV